MASFEIGAVLESVHRGTQYIGGTPEVFREAPILLKTLETLLIFENVRKRVGRVDSLVGWDSPGGATLSAGGFQRARMAFKRLRAAQPQTTLGKYPGSIHCIAFVNKAT